MGPRSGQEPQLSIFNRLQYKVEKAVENYFLNPIHYLTFGSVGLIIVGLFLGMEFSWEFYGVVGILSAIKTYDHFYGGRKK